MISIHWFIVGRLKHYSQTSIPYLFMTVLLLPYLFNLQPSSMLSRTLRSKSIRTFFVFCLTKSNEDALDYFKWNSTQTSVNINCVSNEFIHRKNYLLPNDKLMQIQRPLKANNLAIASRNTTIQKSCVIDARWLIFHQCQKRFSGQLL